MEVLSEVLRNFAIQWATIVLRLKKSQQLFLHVQFLWGGGNLCSLGLPSLRVVEYFKLHILDPEEILDRFDVLYVQ